MNNFDTIKVATAYKIGNETVGDFPYECPNDVEPVYREFPGWKSDITGVRKYEDFPEKFKQYVDFIEKETGCPIRIISVGPDRKEIVLR
jgi:adenylosuccinate synthase